MYEEPNLHLNMSKEKYDELVEAGHFATYDGMYPDMVDGGVMIDDPNHYETEELIEIFHPDLIFSGIRDKYISHKMGVPSKQLHSYDYSGPYAGFRGSIIFAKDVANALSTPAWQMITPPWDKTETEGGD